MSLRQAVCARPEGKTLSVWEKSKYSWISLPEGMQHLTQARV